MSNKNIKIRKLSLDFARDVYRDNAKIFLLPSKIVMQSLGFWPDSQSLLSRIVSWFIFLNVVLAEIFNIAYSLVHVKELILAVIGALTVITNFETIVRLHIILFNKGVINNILVKVWKEFWPMKVLSLRKRNQIITKTKTLLFLVLIFTAAAIPSNTKLSLKPLLHHQFVFKSSFPFNSEALYTYEIIFTWQYFVDWYVMFMACAFDFFFISLMSVCITQYIILQDVMRALFSEESKSHRKIIFGERGINMTDKEMLFECLKQHKLLIKICSDLENAMSTAILLQFVVSVGANCIAFLILNIDSSLLVEVFPYCVAHLLQLFYFCYVGQDLTHESGNLSTAIYESDWHLCYDLQLRKSLVLMIQRSQQEQRITAVGLIELNLESFVKLLRLSFSIYTLLDSFLVVDDE